MANKDKIPDSKGGGTNIKSPSELNNGFSFSSKKDVKKYSNSIKKWVLNDVDKTTIEFADEFGKYIAEKRLTTSQIRTAFGEMRRIQTNGFSEKTRKDFILLKPKLAYAVKRHNIEGLEAFYYLFEVAYDHVDTDDISKGSAQFNNLMMLMEAILAYHKFHGGKE